MKQEDKNYINIIGFIGVELKIPSHQNVQSRMEDSKVN